MFWKILPYFFLLFLRTKMSPCKVSSRITRLHGLLLFMYGCIFFFFFECETADVYTQNTTRLGEGYLHCFFYFLWICFYHSPSFYFMKIQSHTDTQVCSFQMNKWMIIRLIKQTLVQYIYRVTLRVRYHCRNIIFIFFFWCFITLSIHFSSNFI